MSLTDNLHLLLPEFLLAGLAFVIFSADLLLLRVVSIGWRGSASWDSSG